MSQDEHAFAAPLSGVGYRTKNRRFATSCGKNIKRGSLAGGEGFPDLSLTSRLVIPQCFHLTQPAIALLCEV